MPESKASATSRAKRRGLPAGNVVKASRTPGSYYIAPAGVKLTKAKRAYADCRAGGGKASTCAAVSHGLDKRLARRH